MSLNHVWVCQGMGTLDGLTRHLGRAGGEGVSAESRMRDLEARFMEGPYNSGSLSESSAFRYVDYK